MPQVDKILSLAVAGLALLMFVLSLILVRINRQKLFFAAALTAVYSIFTAYYLYLSFFFTVPLSIMETEVIKPPAVADTTVAATTEEEPSTPDFWVIVQAENATIEIAPDDEMEIKKTGRFQIKEVRYPGGDGTEDLRADLKGFAGNARFNNGQDIGYWITYERMLQHWSVEGEKDKFEVVIKNRNKILGSIYVRFME